MVLNKGLQYLVVLCAVPAILLAGCSAGDNKVEYPAVNRNESLPLDINKQGPETDRHPPILHSDDYETPVPLPLPVNTKGGEDSPFILPEGDTLYFFFTPDIRIPHESQLFDGVTGIYVSKKSTEGWTEPERIWLEEPGKLSLDGAVCIQGDEMWFGSAREGYLRGVPKKIIYCFIYFPDCFRTAVLCHLKIPHH